MIDAAAAGMKTTNVGAVVSVVECSELKRMLQRSGGRRAILAEGRWGV
jgi:hypothetical protein